MYKELCGKDYTKKFGVNNKEDICIMYMECKKK